jgi:trafficking protein particle complex subunit 1
MIYNLYIFDRTGSNVYYKEWNRKNQSTLKDCYFGDTKLIYGLVFSLCQFCSGIAPKPTSSFNSFKTETYKLHYYCSPTKYKFILLTDPNAGNLNDFLKDIYSTIFVEYVLKNPLHKPFQEVKSYLFDETLDKFVTQQTYFH